ncbi:MAG: hypothetical protein WBP22_06270 [Candidatus Saccharimonas sp.]
MGAVIIVGLFIGGFYTYNLLQSKVDSSKPETDPYERKVDLNQPTDEQIKTGKATKEKSLTDTSQNNISEDPDFIVTAKNINTTASLLQIRTLLSEIVSQGTCTLTLTKGSSTISRSVALQAGPADSTCQGFDIPLSELSNGTWNIRITAETPDISKTTEDKVDVSGI